MEKQLTPAERFALALADYVGCQKPYCLIRRADLEMLSPRAFNMEHNALANAIVGLKARYNDDAAKFAIASPRLQKVRTICYRPDGAPIIEGMFNMWKDPHIEPLPGKPEIFLEHLRYLIPNTAERHALIGWLAWIAQHPDQKVMWAILIVGRGGTGKSWIGKVMERIFGADNAVLISEEDALTSTFNGFSENKRLVFVHEMPSKELADVLGKVKGLITESHLLINRKGIERYKAENLANLLAVSNDDVQVSRTNRRWAVIRAADDPVGVDDNGKPTPEHAAYYSRLWGVIPPDGEVTAELRRIVHYLRALPLDHPKVAFDRLMAPLTVTKEEAAATGTDGERTPTGLVLEAYQNREGPFRFDLLTQEEVREHCGGTLGHSLAEAMTEAGCRKVRRANGLGVQIYLGKKDRPWLWAINKTVAERHRKATPGELAKLYRAEREGVAKVAPMPDADTSPDFE